MKIDEADANEINRAKIDFAYMVRNVTDPKTPNFDAEPPVYRVTWGLIGALVGGFVVAMMTGTHLTVLPNTGVTYNDLAAVLLTAVGVLLTVFALAAGLAALWGYREFKDKMKDVAREAATKVTRDIADVEFAAQRNKAQKEIARQRSRIEDAMNASLASSIPLFEEEARAAAMRVLSPEALREIVGQVVQTQLFGDPLDAELDADVALADADDILHDEMDKITKIDDAEVRP